MFGCRNKKLGVLLVVTAGAFSCAREGGQYGSCGSMRETGSAVEDKMGKTEEEWRKELSPEVYRVMRERGTETAFTGQYHKHKEEGTYHCAACGNPLFSSETKFESGTGWPSFYAPVSEQGVETATDRGHGRVRTEVHCAKCGGHLGHVFEDGPQPTGLRYCINSVSLEFEKEGANSLEGGSENGKAQE